MENMKKQRTLELQLSFNEAYDGTFFILSLQAF